MNGCGSLRLLWIFFLGAAALGARAATITVNSNADPAGFDPALTVGTLGPVVTFRDAITAANNTPGDHTLVFDATMNGATVTLLHATSTMDPHASPRNNGGPTAIRITANVEIIAPPGGLILRPDGLKRLLDIAPGATVRVERLTLRGGVANNGGGFWNEGDLTLEEVTMTSCVASSLFISNSNDLGYGGAVYNAGQLTVRDSFFGFNNGQNAGGAIFSTAQSSLSVTNSTFQNNLSEFSGAAIGTESTTGNAHISHSVFKDNWVEFSGNWPTPQAYAGGGAVVNAGVLSIQASTFESNVLRTSVRGGAVLNHGTLSIVDSTFAGNSALSAIARGGAIFNDGTLELTNLTLAGNSARHGSAVDNAFGVMMHMVNCTVARNVQNHPDTFALNVGTAFTNILENNLVVENDRWDPDSLTFVPANVNGSLNSAGTNFIGNTDVMLGVLADNGGPVKTMALPSGSPAVNAGISIPGLTTDARGQPRYEAPDLGAYELPTFAPLFTSPTSAVFIKGQANAFQLTATSGLPLTFAPLIALPSGLTLSPDGLVSGDPAVPSGVYHTVVRASNGYNFTDSPLEITVTDGTTEDRFSWRLNGGAQYDSQVFTLTDGDFGQRSSAWYLFKQDINAFEVSFDYVNEIGEGADGIAFVVQDSPEGPAALGGGGGGLGYTGIRRSFALMVNIFAGAPGGPGIQVSTDGAGISADNPYIPTPQANPAATNPIRFNLTYLDGQLDVTMTDLVSNTIFTESFQVEIPAAVLGNQAWIGLTAATGGATSTQHVSNFSFTSLSAVATVVVNSDTDPSGFDPSVILSALGTTITLRDAVNAANNHANPVLIRFAPELAGATISLMHVGDTTNGNSALTIRGRVTIENDTAGALTIRRGTAGDMRLFRVNADAQFELRKLRLEGGRVWTAGLFGGNMDNYGDLTIHDSVIAGGESFQGGGGLHNDGTTRVERSVFQDNTARNAGGGIFNRNTLHVTASAMVSNQTLVNGGGPAGGGGIQNLGSLTVTNSTFAHNVAGNFGGGAIWNWVNGQIEIVASTVFGNSGNHPGGIGGLADHNFLLMRNTILADGSNMILLAGSTNNLFSNPGLGTLGFHGGPTPTFPITAASAAHKAGAVLPGLTTDQRGRARHAVPDIGAYELYPRDGLIVSTAIDEDDGTADVEQGTGTSLREALWYAQGLAGPQTITFAPALAGQTIPLGAGWNGADDPSALAVTGTVTIQGLPNAPGVTIAMETGANRRHFLVGEGASLTLRHLTLLGGQASAGGSVLNTLGSLTVRDSTFADNTAIEGGAIHATQGSPLLVLENSTFSNNIATHQAGALFTGAQSNLFRHITVTANVGPGALFLDNCTVTIHNSIVAGNLNDNVATAAGGVFDPSSGGNVFGAGNPAGISNGVNGNVTGVAAPNLFLGPLSLANGGPTPTVALLPNSPAVNRGTPLAGFTTDQRGTNRVIGFAPDAGAFEFVLAESGIVTTLLDEFDVTSDPGFGTGTSLREALYYTTGTVSFSSELAGQTAELTRIGDTQFGNTAILLTAPTTRFIRATQAPGLTIRVNGSEPMRHFRLAPGAQIALQSLTLTGGHAPNGGAVLNQGTLTLSNATLADNTATEAGGAVLIDTNATLTATTSTFSGNTAGDRGGAIANRGGLTLTAATIAGNSAGTSGGGIHNDTGSSSPMLTATIVAGNTDGLGDPSNIGGPQPVNVDANHNLIGPGGSGGLVHGENGNLVGIADAGLAPLANYGGRSPTRALYPWSPAIDAAAQTGTGFDQRGLARGSLRDIGAFELIRSPNAVTLGGLTLNPPNPSVGGPGTFSFSFDGGVPGATFSVYTTDNLLTPANQWQWIGLVPEDPPGSGFFRALFSNDPDAPYGYFRVQSP